MCRGSAFGGFRRGDKTPLRFSREKIRDPMTAAQCPATNCRTPFGGFRHGDGSAFGGKIVLDMWIIILYTWDRVLVEGRKIQEES